MSHKLEIEEIKEKIHAKLSSSGWGRVLHGFIFSKDFEIIILQLAKQARDGKRFTPTLKNIFKAFEECPYDKLKVVIIGQDPYPGIHEADGIAFSLSKAEQIQPSLQFMFDAINTTVYNGSVESYEKDLKRWSNQGVLLLNIALTTTVGKAGQHYLIWQPFMAYLFDYLSWYCPGLVYIYMGKKAQEWSNCVNDNNYKFFISHPLSASYNNLPSWDSKNVFVETKNILKKNYNFNIEW
jgi:uracil-DNA glycosylase